MILLMIFGMFLVTYIPRMLPMVFTKDIAFPPVIEQWLGYVPYAALGALILPGVLTVNQDYPWIGLIGAGIAFLCAWWNKHILIPLFAAVVTVFVLQQYFVV